MYYLGSVSWIFVAGILQMGNTGLERKLLALYITDLFNS